MYRTSTSATALRTCLNLHAFTRGLQLILLAVSLVLLCPAAAATISDAQDSSADVILVNGNILTGAHLRPNDPDPTPARVHALAIQRGKVMYAGDNAPALQHKGASTTIIDLHGAFAMPGFNDAHTHMAEAGKQRLAVDLVGTHSLPEMQARVRAYVERAKPGAWVLGGGWDHTLWPGRALPSRADLDAVTEGHPALLERVDGHIAVVNTAALQAAHIVASTPDPAGGRIDRAPDGQPSGIVREAPALALLQRVIPPLDTETRRRALRLSIEDALRHGVTSVQDFSDWEDWLVLESLEHDGKLPLRFAEWIAFDVPLPVLEQRRASHSADDPLLHLTFLKAFMDGSLGSRTAALEQPYADDQGNAGLPRYEQESLNQLAAERARAGFQLGFHAIGDRANQMALDAFEAAEQVGTPAGDSPSCVSAAALLRQPDKTTCVRAPRDFRFRIEHAQVVQPDAFERFARLGVIASMQPSHLLTDMAWAESRLGPERSKYAYAWHSFLSHGVTLAFGTDYPVESIDPMRGLFAAVTRQNEAGTQTFEPQERVSLNEALYAYTQASAFAEFREQTKGRLAPGYLADLIVLDRDITAVPPAELLRATVLRTLVGGITRYKAAAAGTSRADDGQ